MSTNNVDIAANASRPGEWVEIDGQRFFFPAEPPSEIEWVRVSGRSADYRDQLSPTWRAQVPGGSLFRTGEGLVFVPRLVN